MREYRHIEQLLRYYYTGQVACIHTRSSQDAARVRELLAEVDQRADDFSYGVAHYDVPMTARQGSHTSDPTFRHAMEISRARQDLQREIISLRSELCQFAGEARESAGVLDTLRAAEQGIGADWRKRLQLHYGPEKRPWTWFALNDEEDAVSESTLRGRAAVILAVFHEHTQHTLARLRYLPAQLPGILPNSAIRRSERIRYQVCGDLGNELPAPELVATAARIGAGMDE